MGNIRSLVHSCGSRTYTLLVQMYLHHNKYIKASINHSFFNSYLDEEDGHKIRGLIVDRPIYLGLDYKWMGGKVESGKV